MAGMEFLLRLAGVELSPGEAQVATSLAYPHEVARTRLRKG